MKLLEKFEQATAVTLTLEGGEQKMLTQADLKRCVEALSAREAPSKEAHEEMKNLVLAERDKGNVLVLGIEGPMTMPLEEFVKQPVEGILYDLNRSEEVSLTFMSDRKWVNDFAVALTIRKLVEQRDSAASERNSTQDNKGDSK